MCDIEKQGAVSFPVSSLYPIRSEKKGALSLAKDYRPRDWRACPRLNVYALLTTRKQTRCGHGHSREILRFGPALVRSEQRVFRSRFDHWRGSARSSLIVARLSYDRERARAQLAVA